MMGRVLGGVLHLVDRLQDVPVHVIPCIEGRTDGKGVFAQASRWGSIMPAAWSFMLASRSRGLGTVWTTFHLAHEQEAAELLGIPYEEVMQAALIPVAYTVGTEFKPAVRAPLASLVHGTAGSTRSETCRKRVERASRSRTAPPGPSRRGRSPSPAVDRHVPRAGLGERLASPAAPTVTQLEAGQPRHQVELRRERVAKAHG